MQELDEDIENHQFEPSNKVRERVALVLFCTVIAAAIFVVSLYFGTAKAFNVAATKVDEKAGTMEFCSSIIYSGTLEKMLERGKATDNSSLKKVYASDVRNQYIDKQAEVITVDLLEISKTEKPFVLDVGLKQVGVFAVQNYFPKSQVEKAVSELKEAGADVVLCIAPRSNMLGTYDNIDAILCTKEPSPTETTEDHIKNTFVFRSAEVGQVGVLSISTSNAFIHKVVSG